MNTLRQKEYTMPQRWKDQYEHLGLSATVLQGCIFQLYFLSDEHIKSLTWSKYTPPQYPRRPRRDIFTYVLLMHHIILYLLLSKKDPIEATLIYDSLLRFQFRVRHDRLKCKSVFGKGGFLIIPR